MFKGINQLLPGHVLKLSPERYEINIRRFWHEGLYSNGSTTEDRNCLKQKIFMDIFKNAVKSRLISDVPLGTYNSGGVD